MQRKKKIVWAVDPFVNERELQSATAWPVRALSKETGSNIEPVYVLDEYPIGLAIETPVEVTNQAREAGQDELDRLLTRVKLQNLSPLKVLPGPSEGQRGVAETLLAYANQVKADLIVMSTHARTGLERWFVGSFAESLIIHAEVPLLIVNPSWKSVTDFGHLLFPTDFSDESKFAFEQVLEFARDLRADITIFHHLSSVVRPILRAALVRRPAFREALEQRIESSQAEANRLAGKARALGIEAHTFIDCEQNGSTADAILRFAERNHFVIAMSARGGRWVKGFSSITTRDVVRRALYPVLVFHPTESAVEAKSA